MSTVLLTGMTASQTSQSANTKSHQFAHVIHTALGAGNHDVVWADPDIHWTQKELDEKFDVILVGIAPLTGLPANRAYGALTVIDRMYNSDKLCFFIDAPEPSQIVASLDSVARGSSNLFKDFYSYRKFFKEAQNEPYRLHVEDAVTMLTTRPWPLTIYPSLPWEKDPLQLGRMEIVGLPYGLNLDSFIVQAGRSFASPREDIWAIDSYRTRWSLSVAKGLVHPTTPMRQSKGSTDADVDMIMDAALGSILSPQKTGSTWWSYRFAQALNAVSPIATEWRESSQIGDAWNHLPAAIEGMRHRERLDLSYMQKQQYLSAVNNREKALSELESVLGIKRRTW